jgi:alpha-tubulin suppressor-like RCC1 family protein
LGNNLFKSSPVKVPGDHKFAQLNTFGRHTCGIDRDSKAWCWGTNSWGSLGSGTNISQSYVPVAVAGGLSFKKVSAGSDHSCGITLGSVLYCWGNNDWRQLGTGNNTVANSPVAVNIPEAVIDVATGAGSTCAVGVSTKAYCWGANSIGQVGDGQKINYGNVFVALPSVVVGGHAYEAIDASQQFACGLNTAGAAYCWGSNQTKLGNGPQGTDTSTPVAVSGGLTFQSLSTGFTHSCAIAPNADLYCWGSNGNGQLGVAGTHSYVPVRAANNMKAAEVAASGIGTGSGSHTCAISQDRLTVQCWGRNEYGQLGNGQTTTPASVNSAPVIVIGQKPLPQN